MNDNRSVQRCSALLRSFRSGPGQSLTALSKAVDLPHSTVLRFLTTLESEGYVRKEGTLWSLTPQLLEIGFAALANTGVNDVIQSALQELADQCASTASIGERSRTTSSSSRGPARKPSGARSWWSICAWAMRCRRPARCARRWTCPKTSGRSPGTPSARSPPWGCALLQPGARSFIGPVRQRRRLRHAAHRGRGVAAPACAARSHPAPDEPGRDVGLRHYSLVAAWVARHGAGRPHCLMARKRASRAPFPLRARGRKVGIARCAVARRTMC